MLLSISDSRARVVGSVEANNGDVEFCSQASREVDGARRRSMRAGARPEKGRGSTNWLPLHK